MPTSLLYRTLAAPRGGVLVAMAALVAAAPHASLIAQPPAPAPYVRPTSGTRYVYRDFVNVVTRSVGWRTYFTDDKGRRGLRTGLFIADNPTQPLTVDDTALARLWPLRLGHVQQVPVHRGPLQWRWEISVVDTATVAVPAGRFQTYVVTAVEVPVVAAVPQPPVNFTTFWYAPSLGTVVRFKSGQLVGPRRDYPVRQELVRVERPARGG